MSFLKNPRFWLFAAMTLAVLVILQQIWQWEVERVEVPPGKFLVRVHKWGLNLPENEIVAPDDSYKGVMLDVLPEGRFFINPLFWTYQVHDMVRVPVGKCLVLTRKYGKQTSPASAERPEGDILARDDGERGILPDPLPPGSYRINPFAYAVEEVDAIEVKISEVGVRTLKVGKDPSKLPADATRGRYTVPDGYRGIQKSTVPPGTYYLNPYVESITPVEVRSHRVELTDISFPSRDGFTLKPIVVVEYAVQPAKTAELMVRMTDSGELHQADETIEEQSVNEVLQKVILPHVRGYARLEGSNYDARDFILIGQDDAEEKATNAREAMQKALLDKVKPRCEELGVEIRAVTLAELLPPVELSDQIAQRELARVEQEKSKSLLTQYAGQQELTGKLALKEQAKEKVAAGTRLIQAKTKADQLKEVALSRLKQELAAAEIQLQASRKKAEAVVVKGQAEAAVISLQNEAEVAGLVKSVQGFGNIQDFAQYHVLSRLTPALSEIFASDESDFARIFTGFLTPRPRATAADSPSTGGTSPAPARVQAGAPSN